MFDFISTYRWELLIVTEIIFFASIAAFLVTRYFLGWRHLSVWLLPIFILSVLIDVYIGWVDYKVTGEFSKFQFIIIIFIVYAATSGLSDFRRLDVAIQRKVARWKGEPEPEISVKLPPKYGRAHAKHERKGWYIHLLIFTIVQCVMILFVGVSDQFTIEQLFEKEFYEALFDDSHHGIYANEGLNDLFKLWLVILVIDGVISFSYTFFPKKQ